ncbi:MAG: DUF3465 domain-containing protein [Betaproteobacteria bacterium]|nr:DUF3465 domain-containing protein [Betaproteobacteria bacterium]
MKTVSFLWVCLLALTFNACSQGSPNTEYLPQHAAVEATDESDNATIEQAFSAKLSNVQVKGSGVVSKLLPDDNKGSRHQKFLVQISSEQSLLFTHNIDLAPRVPMKVGDKISFNGEYVYNSKGGIIHWTHHAPQQDHESGWIMLDGEQYQ